MDPLKTLSINTHITYTLAAYGYEILEIKDGERKYSREVILYLCITASCIVSALILESIEKLKLYFSIIMDSYLYLCCGYSQGIPLYSISISARKEHKKICNKWR